jgi:nucleotide-binding universal stress UspA family protein
MYQRILLATDGSPLSEPATRQAIALAKLCGAQLLALYAVPYYPRSYLEGAQPLQEPEVQQVEARWLAQGQALVDGLAERAHQQGVHAVPLCVKAGQPAEAVLEVAKQRDCDLVVMASHGRHGMARLLLGSETQRVLTHAHIPVLVVRS